MKVIKRADVPEMRSIVVDGVTHDLGVLKHWRKEPHLKGILPRDLDVSLAWVRLEKDQVLDPHIHPVHSLVVCCEGAVRSTGDLEASLEEGDIMIIPTGYRHGFVGAGTNGFWGLSIQFESLALYEDLDSPLVTFLGPDHDSSAHVDAVTILIQKNEHFVKRFGQARIFGMLSSGAFGRPDKRARLLDLLQVWSSMFQKILYARCAFTDSRKFALVSRAHLDDEFGHDATLGAGRAAAMQVWDPILESTAQWFLNKMLSVDDAEKTVLVHLVLEGAAIAFYERFRHVMGERDEAFSHFAAHTGGDTPDVKHMKMGLDVLRQFPLRDHGSLLEIQRRGWDMFDAMFDRIADLLEKAPSPQPEDEALVALD